MSERLPMSREAEYRMYFELREMGEGHEMACSRLGKNPRTMADRMLRDRKQGMDVPEPPEGYKMTDNWNEPRPQGMHAWLRDSA